MPLKGRSLYDKQTDEVKADPHAVAKMCVDMTARARPARLLLQSGPLSEFVGLVLIHRTGPTVAAALED